MARKRARTSQKSQSSAVMLPGELVVVTRREAAFRSSAGRFESASGQNVSDLANLLKRHGARMSPIFGATEERVMARMAAVQGSGARADGGPVGLLSRRRAGRATRRSCAIELAASELVEAAFVKPPAELPRSTT